MMLLIRGEVKPFSENRNLSAAADWHDGQFEHGAYAGFARRARQQGGQSEACPPLQTRRARTDGRHGANASLPTLQFGYFDRYALDAVPLAPLDAVPLATDIDGAPGAIVQLVELRVKVESTMDRPVEVRLDVELAVSFRLGM
jgi:hypothetical protein